MNDRLNLGGIGDDYVLGVLCSKLGLIDYALRQLAGIVDNEERTELFYLGINDAPDCELHDLARDFYKLRKKDTRQFDRIVSGTIGRDGLADVLEVIENREEYVFTNPIIEEFFQGMSSSLGVDRAISTEG